MKKLLITMLTIMPLSVLSEDMKNIPLRVSGDSSSAVLIKENWEKVLGQCPGFLKYESEMQLERFRRDQEATQVEIDFKVNSRVKNIPKSYGVNGLECTIAIVADGLRLGVIKPQCISLCLDKDMSSFDGTYVANLNDVPLQVTPLQMVEQDSEKKVQKKEKLPKKTAEERNAEKEVACRKELSCWAETKFFSASSACQKQIERLAQYDFEWTDGMLEPKFSHYRWHNISNGSVTYIGDKFKAQNGFGAWSNVIYECDYDLVNEAVLDVRAEQGRL